MDLRRLVSIRVICVLVFELCVLTPMINSHIQGCSIEGIDLSQCLNQGSISSIDICCETLDQVVQAGYSCLCSSAASSIHALSTPLSLPFSNWDIFVPPLTLCRGASPKELITQSSEPSQNVAVPPPSNEMQIPWNTTRNDNYTTVAMQPHSIENPVPKLGMSKDGNESSSNGKDGTRIFLRPGLLLSLALRLLYFISLIL